MLIPLYVRRSEVCVSRTNTPLTYVLPVPVLEERPASDESNSSVLALLCRSKKLSVLRRPVDLADTFSSCFDDEDDFDCLLEPRYLTEEEEEMAYKLIDSTSRGSFMLIFGNLIA